MAWSISGSCGRQLLCFEEFGESVLQVPGTAVGEAKVLMQEGQRAALPANLQTFFQLGNRLRPIVRGRSRQSEISQSLGAIHDVLLRLQGIKALLKLLCLLRIGLDQLAGKIVKGLAMIRLDLDDLSPLRDSSITIAAMKQFLPQHE